MNEACIYIRKCIKNRQPINPQKVAQLAGIPPGHATKLIHSILDEIHGNGERGPISDAHRAAISKARAAQRITRQTKEASRKKQLTPEKQNHAN